MIKDKEFLYEEYVVKGKSTKQIAREQDCAASTVSTYLFEFGFPPRATGLPNQRRGQVPYGSRVVHGRVVENKTEMRIIIKMAELRAQGRSFGDIVTWLNVNGVKTKSRSAAWDRPTVYGILKRTDVHTSLSTK